MLKDRQFWLSPFPKHHFPNWPCPQCQEGVLRPLEGSFKFEESGAITQERIKHGEYFDYDVYTFRYSVLLKCNNHSCQERVSSCGHGYVEEDLEDTEGPPQYTEYFYPEYFYPALWIFSIEKKCPVEIVIEVMASFNLFFADPSASANYVRKAVDAILTNKRIKRFNLNNKGKKIPINLHNRIVEFEKSQPEIAKKLFAIKWLGNEGSHTNTMTKNDVLDAYEILQEVMDDLYIGNKKLIEKKVLRINKSKKPLHPST